MPPLTAVEDVRKERLQELEEAEKKLHSLLYLAGAAVSSLDPSRDSGNIPGDDRVLSQEARDILEQERRNGEEGRFEAYAKAYYEELNSTQITLRTSVAHLKQKRAPAAPLTTPVFSGVGTRGMQRAVGAGGVSFTGDLELLENRGPPQEGFVRQEESQERDPLDVTQLSLAALERQKEALSELVALRRRE